MLLAEADEIPAEADGDTGGFDMWRYRARPGRDLSCSVGAETRCVRAGRDRSTGTSFFELHLTGGGGRGIAPATAGQVLVVCPSSPNAPHRMSVRAGAMPPKRAASSLSISSRMAITSFARAILPSIHGTFRRWQIPFLE